MKLDDLTYEKILGLLGSSVDALIVADQSTDEYKAVTRKGVFLVVLDENGTYTDLVKKLWFHLSNSEKDITEEYQVFIPNLGKFVGKYSKRLKLNVHNITHIVQMTIHPVEGSGQYVFVLDELDDTACDDDSETQKKVSTIQNIYLFTMCFDLVRDTTSSLSLTEVSDDTMNYQLSYTAWRDMIVNMIWKKDQEKFMERSSPEYLRSHFEPGHMESFDCQMQNLEGVYIWVKLIFSRIETSNENDFRFVYMVQNIHEATVSMKATIKHYEELASLDPLTKIYNHGRIETEFYNAIERSRKEKMSAAMLMIDIDYFKKVNDDYGHAVGDSTLTHFTQIIRDELTRFDSAFGRWGGEEFAAVVYGITDEELSALAESIRRSVAAAEFDVVGSVTCSVGAAMLRRDDVLESWFERADQAVYAAKSEGRDKVCML
ncbi:MAG: GGDEF domain-containing protein [Ruminococcus sp.]|nr:GGDEF domain-containing protein [Ruminococcus sp.]